MVMWAGALILPGVYICVVPLNSVLLTHMQTATRLGVKPIRLAQPATTTTWRWRWSATSSLGGHPGLC